MSSGLFLEADNRFTREVFLKILSQFDISQFVEEKKISQGKPIDFISGVFNPSFMSFNTQWPVRTSEILAEQFDNKNWDVGTRIYFRYVNSTYSICNAQVGSFIQILNSICSSYFVLSFEYENTLAVKDENGFRILESRLLVS